MTTRFRLTSALKTGQTMQIEELYDVVIIGGGPAGITAGIYSARYGLKTVLVTKYLGGHVTEAPLVDDYPGLPEIPGQDLVDRFVKHVNKYGIPVILDEAVNIYRKDPSKPVWTIRLRSGREVQGYAVIIAVGSEKRKLGVPGEDELIGKGVSYCATCDGPLFKDKVVAVVGGGNSALISAIYLSKLASRVYLIHRREEFRAFKTYVDIASATPNITILKNTVVKEVIGRGKLEAIKIQNLKSEEVHEIKVDGLFVEIGLEPPVNFFKQIGLELDETGRAKVNVDRSTNLPGIYVAGDAAGGPYKYRFEQIITAAADGAIAADAACKYVCTVKHSLNGPA